MASVGVYIGAGSRHEDLETTGTSYILNKMLTRGTAARSKVELAEEVENMGGVFNSHVDREFQNMKLQVFKDDVSRAISMLGDMVCNSTLNDQELELVKEEVLNEHEDNHHRYEETTLENSHFNAYREHMIGQPIKGDRDNNSAISSDFLNSYRSTNFYGDNIVVVATGDVSHDQIVEQVEQHFESM